MLTHQHHTKQRPESLICLQARLDELESELLEVNANSERLQRSYSELLELQLVLEKAGSFFDDAQHRASSSQFECVLGLASTRWHACVGSFFDGAHHPASNQFSSCLFQV